LAASLAGIVSRPEFFNFEFHFTNNSEVGLKFGKASG
jgi:hypothetical protein